MNNLQTYQENWENLANKIVLRAIKDYLDEDESTIRSRVRKDRIRDFFHSSLFSLITDIDPDDLIKKLDNDKKEFDWLSEEYLEGVA